MGKKHEETKAPRQKEKQTLNINYKGISMPDKQDHDNQGFQDHHEVPLLNNFMMNTS